MTKDRQYWDRVAAGWLIEHPQGLWRRHSDRVYGGLLRRWLPEARAARLLKTDLFDETVSEGLYPVLTHSADEVCGIDLAPSAVRSARMRHTSLHGVVSDVRRLPFDDGTFDIVISNSTLDHFDRQPEIVVALRELRRVLRPGGGLLVTLDNLANPAIALRNALPNRLLQRLGWVPYDVGASFSPAGLRRALGAAGFSAVRMTTVMHHPSVLAVRLAAWVQRHASSVGRERFLAVLDGLEALGSLPTARFTGHYVAAWASRDEDFVSTSP